MKINPSWVLGSLFFFALPAFSASIKLNGTSGNTCDYSQIDVAAGGDVSVTCSAGLPSTGATFTIIPASTTVAINTDLSLDVKRQISSGGSPGAETLVLNLGDGAVPSQATVNFASGDGTNSTKSAGTVRFSSVGQKTISFSSGVGSSNSGPSATITVNGGGSGNCSGVTPPVYQQNLGILETARTMPSGPHVVSASSTGTPAMAAFQFTVPVSGNLPTMWRLSFEGTVYASHTKDVTVASCAGDFTNYVTGCFRSNTNSLDGINVAPTAGAGTSCVLTPGGTYYFNVRTQQNGVETGFMMNITPLTF